MNGRRLDFRIIADWIRPQSRVLDLGCGDGTLLDTLARTKKVSGYGLELDDQHVTESIRRGVNVIQTDLDAGLSEFDDHSFDYVILSLTLQAVKYPERLLREMLRVGTEGIVTFPNFGYWVSRVQLLRGRMPVSRALPHEWYNTPNIHLCTLQDFEDLCRKEGIRILESEVVDHEHRRRLGLRLFPNLLGEIALYRFRRA
ncbi:MAG: methionine biosynthesis protein MetW [Gammaproteobacteria bacterium]|nr:methionine biosynthesis protein MetW [Gammaproteobacteria bacterium]